MEIMILLLYDLAIFCQKFLVFMNSEVESHLILALKAIDQLDLIKEKC